MNPPRRSASCCPATTAWRGRRIDMTVEKCQEERRSFVLIDADFEERVVPFSFRSQGEPRHCHDLPEPGTGLRHDRGGAVPAPSFGSNSKSKSPVASAGRGVTSTSGAALSSTCCTAPTADVRSASSFFQLGDIHDLYLERSRSAHAMLASGHNEADTDAFQGKGITEQEYHQQVEAFAGACPCGGRFLLAGQGADARSAGPRTHWSALEKDDATGLTTFPD